jgi:hypothetical protein
MWDISSAEPDYSLEPSTNGNQYSQSLMKLRVSGVRGLNALINGEIESVWNFSSTFDRKS